MLCLIPSNLQMCYTSHIEKQQQQRLSDDQRGSSVLLFIVWHGNTLSASKDGIDYEKNPFPAVRKISSLSSFIPSLNNPLEDFVLISSFCQKQFHSLRAS